MDPDPTAALDALADVLQAQCPTCILGDGNAIDDDNYYPNHVNQQEILYAQTPTMGFLYDYRNYDLSWSPSWSEYDGENPAYPINGNYGLYADFTLVTPEPGSLATMLGGAAILALMERKRRTHRN
jgi:hypothetical protein